MRRVVIAAVAVIALGVGAVTPSAAQESDDLVIDPEEGAPGDVVDGQVPAEVVAEHCVTDPEAIRQQFNSGDTAASYIGPPGPVFQAYLEHGPLIGIDPDPSNPFPDLIDDIGWAWFDLFQSGVAPNQDVNAARILWLVMDSIGSTTWPTDLFIEPYLEATFVLTFADIATQEPIGELSNFDMSTGAGQVTVPEVEPGLYAVAAACVEPVITDASFLAAIEAGAAWLEDNAVPLDANPVTYGPEEGWLLENISAVMFPELMQPRGGPWTATFCVDCDPPASVNDAAAFCGVLPDIQGVPDRLEALFAGANIDDPATYPSAADLEALVNDVRVLLFGGDTSVPPTVAPQWTIATEDLRDLVWGMSAVEYDFALLVDLSPEDAQRLIDQGSGEPGEPDPEFDAALEVLTQFFLDNCITGGPAVPVDAVARFAG